jgi:hypothetical protein
VGPDRRGVIRPVTPTTTRGESVSTFRKTVMTTAIIGAGLATTAGSAFATTNCDHDGGHQESHKSASQDCSNTALGKIDNSHAKTLIGVLDGSQGAAGANICHNLNNNKILSGNNVALLGGIIHS